MTTAVKATLLALPLLHLGLVGLPQRTAAQTVPSAPANPTPAQAPQRQVRPSQQAQPQRPQDEIQRDREWLVAYLIAHQGYRVDQMDELEKRIDRMSPTQVETLVDVYRQKHEMALEREAQWNQMRQQMLNIGQQQRAQANQRNEDYRHELDAAAGQEQQRLNQQQESMMQGFQQKQLNQHPYGGSGGGLYGPFNYGVFYDRYWH